MAGFGLPNPFENFEAPSLPNPFGGGSLELYPSDVQFQDIDGDVITLREARGKVDFYVGNQVKLSGARLRRNGNTIEITGTVKKGTPLSFLGFNLEDVITEGVTPVNAADCDAAMALVE